jgi:hypothetical protein
MLCLFFLGDVLIEGVLANLADFVPECGVGLDVVVHFVDAHQVHPLLIVVVKLLIALHQLLSQQQHSHPHGIHLDMHFLLRRWLILANFFELERLQAGPTFEAFIEGEEMGESFALMGKYGCVLDMHVCRKPVIGLGHFEQPQQRR